MRTRLVFVHGIGPARDVNRELVDWTTALAAGAQRAGHAAFADQLRAGAVDTVFAHYGDLFRAAQAQGAGGDLGDDEAQMLWDLLTDLIDEQLVDADDPDLRRVLAHARAELVPRAGAQGAGAPVRRVINAATTLLSYAPFGRAGQWLGGKLLVRDLAQVARYLARGGPDAGGRTLDARIRERVHEAMVDRRVVVIAHSLGSVVAWEALHEHAGEVPLLVTLGSPLAMRTVVWPHLVPTPPRTPPSVRRWLNLWDRDDIIVARPRLEDDVLPNLLGVTPSSSRIDSDGLWVHTATKYLSTSDLAGPVAEAVTAGVAGDLQ